jgi:hypothetical protein
MSMVRRTCAEYEEAQCSMYEADETVSHQLRVTLEL